MFELRACAASGRAFVSLMRLDGGCDFAERVPLEVGGVRFTRIATPP
jgi:hypothetical protein